MSRGNRSRPAGERTPEERERAREERERRRSASAGVTGANGLGERPADAASAAPEAVARQAGAAADEGSVEGDHAPADPGTPTAQPERPVPQAAETFPAAGDPLPGAGDTLAEPGHPLPGAGDTVPPAEGSFAGPVERLPDAGEPAPATQGAGQDGEQQPPPPRRRVVVPSRQAMGRPPPPAPSTPHPRTRRRYPTRVVAVLALLAVIAAVVLLVRSLRDSSHPGTAAAPAAVTVLIPEGKTRAQIAQIAAAAGLRGNYRSAARSSPLLNPADYGAPRSTPDLEGFLFPATYDMAPRAPAARLVDEQLAAFKENFGPAEVKRARALHVTPYQMLIIASMIEREAAVPGDRAKIAAVIYNRLHRGMPLGVDATVYYAVEEREGVTTLTHELTEAQLHINSPYNTRNRPGLPPTPISNPGVASIRAAARPAHSSYLYYVAAADGCGEHVFSRGLAAFEANVAAYRAAVARNGGRAPVCKRK